MRLSKFKKEVVKDVLIAVIASIIVLHYNDVRYVLFPKGPQLEITGIRCTQVPTDSFDVPSLRIEKDNQTIAAYSAASLSYVTIEVRNIGEKVALVDKLDIEVLDFIPFSPAATPTWNYTIKLHTWEIYSQLNWSYHYSKGNHELNPPYTMAVELTPHFKVESNNIDAFGVYIDSDSAEDTTDYLIKIIIHCDGRTIETYPIWARVFKPFIIKAP